MVNGNRPFGDLPYKEKIRKVGENVKAGLGCFPPDDLPHSKWEDLVKFICGMNDWRSRMHDLRLGLVLAGS